MTACLQLTVANFDFYADDIRDLEKASFRDPWGEEAYRRELDNPVARLWILVHEGRFAGYASFWVFAGEIHLLKIAILPQLRRRGLASVLLKTVIEAGAGEGCRSVWLEVRPSNGSALGLYTKHGFVEVGRRRGYYRDTGEDAIQMYMPVPPESAL